MIFISFILTLKPRLYYTQIIIASIEGLKDHEKQLCDMIVPIKLVSVEAAQYKGRCFFLIRQNTIYISVSFGCQPQRV